MNAFYFLLVTLLFFSTKSSARKVGPEELAIYTSTDKKIVFAVPRTRYPYVKSGEKKWIWKKERLFPKEVLILADQKMVILLGGLGDPGLKLGLVSFYTFQGKLLKAMDLKKDISDLESLSENFGDSNGSFPWISYFGLNNESGKLVVEVCNKRIVSIDLKTFTSTISEKI